METPTRSANIALAGVPWAGALSLSVEKIGDKAILPGCFPHLFNMESCLYSGIFTGFPPFPPPYYYDYYSNKPYA